MAGDLPPGAFSGPLVGAWWPQSSATLHAAAKHWLLQQQQHEQYALDLHREWTRLISQNEGHTADDLVSRFQQGQKHHLNLAEKYKAKADAFEKAANAIDNLREGLRGIADDYNQRIGAVERSKVPVIAKGAEIERLIAEGNGFASHKSGDAVAAIMDATQKILSAEGTGKSPHEFVGVQSTHAGGANAPSVGGGGFSGARHGVGGAGRSGVGADGMRPQSRAGESRGPHIGDTSYMGGQVRTSSGGGVTGVPGPSARLPRAPAVSGPTLASLGGAPPASLGQGLSPNSLSQSIMSGMATSQPVGASAQSLSSGAMQAMGTGSPPPQASSPLAPPVAPSIPMARGESLTPASSPVDAATTSPPSAPTTGGGVPVAPAVMTGGSWSAPAAPVAGGTVAPAGPLPAYGSDLRPPVVAPPAVASAPTAPVSGAAVAPSSPSAGGPMVSPVQRAASQTAAGQDGTSSSALAGASAASAGATTGAVSSRAAEQQRLQRIVDAVARQEPRLSWAVGLRDDGTTRLLVTDLAGGWIPPHVRLPAHVTLLEPAARRGDAGVVDLLGAVVTAAAYEPDAYVAEPGPDAPVLSGDRAARSAAPKVDELGPSLVDAVRRRDGLPRIAQAVATPAVRRTGVLDNEAKLLRACLSDVLHSVLGAYPRHDSAAVGDWMLLAAIEALIDDHEYLANYHLSWFNALFRRGVS